MSLKHSFYSFLWRQSWISLRYKKSVYKRLCNYEDPPDAAFTQDFYGLRYEGNIRDSVEFNIFFYGAFEKPLLHFLRDSFKNIKAVRGEDCVFLDVGANIGQHSLFMSQIAAEVHSFEPYSRVSERLRQHIALNKIENIQIHPVGLSNKQEQLTFFTPTGRNQGIGSFDESTISKGNIAGEKLALVRGDDYLLNQGIERIGLIKIDVEGFEKNVLEGLPLSLSKDRPLIVCEISYGNELSIQSEQELLSLLPDNYQLFNFNNRKPDGRKARRKDARARQSGCYELIPFRMWRDSGQDDVVACPAEKTGVLPLRNNG